MFIDEKCMRIEPTEDLRNKIWNVELEMLEVFKEICEKYNLKYFLIGGALIGAIRHKGFIPWDDDIDIGMSRDDFKKFVEIVKGELPNHLEVQYGVTEEGRFEELLRIRNKNTTGILTRNLRDGMGNGIFIEVYCYTSVPKCVFFQRIQNYVMNFFGIMLDCYTTQTTNRKKTIKQKLLHLGSGLYCKIVPIEVTFKLWDLMHDIFAGRDSELMNCEISTFGIKSGRSIWERNDIEPCMEVPFENTVVRIPYNYDKCLKKCYGDYMTLPPKEERNNLHLCEILYNPDISYTYYMTEEKLQLLEELIVQNITK